MFGDNFFKRVENKTNVNKDTIIGLAQKLQSSNMKDEETLANAETEYKLFQSLNGERYFRKQDKKKKIIIN